MEANINPPPSKNKDSQQEPQKTNKLRWLLLGLFILLLLLISYVGYLKVKEKLTPSYQPDYGPCAPGGTTCFEAEGKVKVVNTPEVQELIKKYGVNNVHIRALDIDLVEDIEFIKQIHPNFKEQTGCIIIVHAGDDGYVYQEDKQLNIIYKETLSEFTEKTKSVAPEIMAKFYLSLH